ncbi:MAG: hypothetical protein PHR77_07930 [Kiritimatiellae bacterium]|nr:hypothetical protein [Kiritimatiellia bacterium]MDD5520963.1 hypothetical protein [Kiritimatiellia bacterium]
MKKAVFTIAMVLGLVSIIGLVGCESEDDDDPSPGALVITPSEVAIPAGTITNVLFAASNGTGNYTWNIDIPALGSIVSSGASAIYTSTTNAGINYIHLTDSSNNTTTASIQQQ